MAILSKMQSLALVAYFTLAASVTGGDLDRCNVVGFLSGASNQDQRDRISNILSKKVRRLAEECQLIGTDFDYLAKYRFTEKKDIVPGLNDEFAKVWNDTLALEVLHGTFFENADKPVLSTTVFFGEFQGPLKSPNFTIEVKITPEEFQSLIDEHSISMHFALAMQAKQLKKPPFVIAAYLSRCRATAGQLGWPQNEARKEFVEVLDSELAKLKTTSKK